MVQFLFLMSFVYASPRCQLGVSFAQTQLKKKMGRSRAETFRSCFREPLPGSLCQGGGRTREEGTTEQQRWCRCIFNSTLSRHRDMCCTHLPSPPTSQGPLLRLAHEPSELLAFVSPLLLRSLTYTRTLHRTAVRELMFFFLTL